MQTGRDEKIRELFLETVRRAPEERDAFLRAACAADPQVLVEVKALIPHDVPESEISSAPFALRLETSAPEERLPQAGCAGEEAPARIGGYEIVAPIATGGMGTVYLARHARMGREVAIKLLPPGLPASRQSVERCLVEARAAARIEHPAIVPVLDAGEDGGRPFIVMQRIRGSSLQEILAEEGRLAPERAFSLLEHIARAVQAAHDAGVVHRDIKPGNILVEKGEGTGKAQERAYLGDFGLALLAGTSSAPIPRGIGTPGFMAPEQARGAAASPLSDVYALGATLYALLCGRPPHAGDGHAEVLTRVATKDPLPIRKTAPATPLDAVLICEKAMRREPSERYRSAGDLADEMDRFLARRPIHARAPTIPYRAGLWVRRKPGVVVASALASLILIALLAAVIRREVILRSAEMHARRHLFDEARGDLAALDGAPWIRESQREGILRFQVALGTGDLGGAAEALESIQGEARDAAALELRRAVGDALDQAEVFVESGLTHTAAAGLAVLAPALAALERQALASGSQDDWHALAVGRFARAAERALLDRGDDERAIDLMEAMRRRDLAAAGRALDAAAATRAFTDSGESEEGGTLISMLSAMRFGPPEAPSKSPQGPLFGFLSLMDEHLLPMQAAHVRRSVGQFLMLEPLGLPLKIGIPSVQDVGDCDGDGRPDLALQTGPSRFEMVRSTERGLEAAASCSLEEEGVEARIENLSVQDLDGDGRSEVIVYFCRGPFRPFESCRGHLRAYALRDESLVRVGVDYPPPGGSSIRCAAYAHPLAIRAADVDGDGAKEILVGTGSFGEDERRLLIIRRPFTERAERMDAPSPDRGGDVMAVFAGDLDRDGSPDFGCVSGPFWALDIRLWKIDPSSGKIVGPLRFGPLGTFDAALAIETPQGPLLFLAMSGAYQPNTEQFPDPPHRGLAPGAYAFRVPDGWKVEPASVPVSAARWEEHFFWADRFAGDFPYPREAFDAITTSTARWLWGQAVVVSWRHRTPESVTHMIDLYVPEPGSGTYAKTRLFHKTGPGGLLAQLVNFPDAAGGPEQPGVLTTEWGPEPNGPAAVRAFVFSTARSLAPAPASRRAEAYLRMGRNLECAAIAKKALAVGGSPSEALEVAVLWTRATIRELDWAEAADAIAALRSVAGAAGHDGGQGALSEEAARLCGVFDEAKLLLAEPPGMVLTHPVIVRGMGGHDRTWTRAHISDAAFQVEKPSAMAMTLEVDIRQLGLDEFVMVALCSGEALPESPDAPPGVRDTWKRTAHGIRIDKSGGSGHTLLYTSWIWPGIEGHHPDPEKVLEEGAAYRLTALRTAEGRVRLRAAPLAKGRLPARASSARGKRVGGGKTKAPGATDVSHAKGFTLAEPPDRAGKAHAGGSSEDQPVCPVTPGSYRLVIVTGSGGAGAREADVEVRAVEVRLREISSQPSRAKEAEREDGR